MRRQPQSRAMTPEERELSACRRAVLYAAGLLLLGGLRAPPSLAQGIDAPVPPERVAARAWFQDAKFGMFIHWGVYSQLGQGEWVMQNRSLPVDSYEWLASCLLYTSDAADDLLCVDLGGRR